MNNCEGMNKVDGCKFIILPIFETLIVRSKMQNGILFFIELYSKLGQNAYKIRIKTYYSKNMV